uniref:Uncharacterized protein n=1 Tax=Caenorhabditis japonica TaxID=281687 RepID=A0A8R1EVQ1_CAEJA
MNNHHAATDMVTRIITAFTANCDNYHKLCRLSPPISRYDLNYRLPRNNLMLSYNCFRTSRIQQKCVAEQLMETVTQQNNTPRTMKPSTRKTLNISPMLNSTTEIRDKSMAQKIEWN